MNWGHWVWKISSLNMQQRSNERLYYCILMQYTYCCITGIVGPSAFEAWLTLGALGQNISASAPSMLTIFVFWKSFSCNNKSLEYHFKGTIGRFWPLVALWAYAYAGTIHNLVASLSTVCGGNNGLYIHMRIHFLLSFLCKTKTKKLLCRSFHLACVTSFGAKSTQQNQAVGWEPTGHAPSAAGLRTAVTAVKHNVTPPFYTVKK